MKQYALTDIISAYEQKKEWEKQFPVSYYIFRKLSFPITYLVLKLTTSPSKVAITGFFIGIAGNISLLYADSTGILPGIILLMIVALSDAVDGNIARTTKNVTYYGKYLDSVLGISIEGTYPLFLGIGLYLWEECQCVTNPFGLFDSDLKLMMLICGAIITAGAVYSNKITETYDYQRIHKEKDSNQFKHDINAKFGTSTYSRNPFYLLFSNLNAFNLQLPVLLICYFVSAVDIFMLFFAGYYLFRYIFILLFYTYRASTRLNT